MANGLLANAHESNTDLLWAGSGGFDTVHHDDTLTGMGTELYPLGVNSAYLNDAPWLSAAKEIAPTQTLQPGQYIQALSSLTVSGYKNHCVAVKGGGFVFPTVDQLKEWVGTDGYLPTSSFNNYTAYNENNISSLYNSAYYLINNKLDQSAFSEWSSHYDPGETYTLVAGNDIAISSDDINKTTTISFTGSAGGGDVEVNNVVHNNSATWNEVTNKLDASSYHELTAGTNIDIQNYVISSKDWTNEIKEASANAFNEATAVIQPTSSTQWNSCYETVNTNSGDWNNVSAKLDISSFEAYTANDETYLLKGGNGVEITSDDVNKETTISVTGQFDNTAVNNVVQNYSANGVWLTAHQDISNLMTKSDSANFYPMTGNPSGFITTETDWTNTITAASAYAYSQATAQIPDPFDPTYISGQIDNKLDKSESANYYPMTGNPSGFLTAHQDLSYISGKIDDKLDTTAFSTVSGSFLTAHQSLDDYYKKTETSSKEQISAAIAGIVAGDPEVNNVVRSFSANGTWLTAHQDLSNYATTSQLEQVSAAVSSIPTLSGGEGVQIVNEDGKNRIDLGLSAGSNMSFVYDQETNTIRLDAEGGTGGIDWTTGTDLSAIVQDNGTSSFNLGQTPSGYGLIVDVKHNNLTYTTELLDNKVSTKLYLEGGGLNYEIRGVGLNPHFFQGSIIRYQDDITKQFTSSVYALNGDGLTYRNYLSGTWMTPTTSTTTWTWSDINYLKSNSANYYTKTETSSKQQISAALQYISSNAGKNYTGVSPIVVNNTTNQISADTWNLSAGNGLVFTDDNANKVTKLEVDGEELSAGPGIAIFESGGYVVISAGNDDYNFFPISGTDGTTNYTANCDCSSFYFTTAQSPAGGNTTINVKGVRYQAYPATDVSASWYNIINTTNNSSNCYCIRFTNDMTAADLANYSAYDKVTVVHSNEYTPDCMLYWDGNTKVFPSGLYCELVKGTNDSNQVDWFFTNSGWINNLWWDWD